MTFKSEFMWSSPNIPQANLADLDQSLGKLSLRYMKQSVELPLNHTKQVVFTRLYSAAKALHQAVREGMVENAIFEISSNLIGCEQVALLVARKQRNRVDFIGSAEFSQERLDTLRRNAKRIIEEAPEDSIFIKAGVEERSFFSSLGISARIPFWLDCVTRGAIVFFDLLPQRSGLDAEDRELLKLLCDYAGPCLATDKTKDREIYRWVQL